jgi:hypothetical protein
VTNLRNLGLAPLAAALLLSSLAFGELAPAFGSGQISAQAYTTADWSSWAATAWAYYTPGVGVIASTGLHKANLGWSCFTDWDLGTYIYSIILARKLNLISDSSVLDSWQFGDRINKVLTFLEKRPLGSSSGLAIPYWAYKSDAMNPFQACSTAFTDPADSGRLLTALYALEIFTGPTSTYSLRVNAIYALTKDSYNSMATKLGSDYYGYMAAEGFAAPFGANGGTDESAVFSVIDNYPATGSFVPVYGQSLPTMRTLSEPFIHAILEPSLVHELSPRFLDFADRTYRAQYGRFSGTGKLTAWSEGGSAYGFIYEWIVYTPNPNSPDQPQTWVIQASTGSILDQSTHPPLAYAKVAFAYLAIYGENAYTLALVNAAKSLANPSQGFSDANLEDGTIPNYGYSDKTNELVLAAASYALSPPPTSDFTVSSNPQTLGAPLGSSVTSTITVSSMNGFSSAVTLSGSWIGSSPSGVTYDFSPSQVTPPSGGSGSSTLTVTVSSAASSGSFQLRVTGTSGSPSRTCDISITILGLTSATTTSSYTTETTQTTTSSQTTQTTTTTPVPEFTVVVTALVLSASLGAALFASRRKHKRSPGGQ